MKVITLKLTDEECDLLDALVNVTDAHCRSEVLRAGLPLLAERCATLGWHVRRAIDSRRHVCSRRRRPGDTRPRLPPPPPSPPEMRTLATVLGL